MCRLLAYASPTPQTFADAVGHVPLAAFTAMARLHDEGWGTAQVAHDGSITSRKAPSSGRHDPDFGAALAGPRSRAGVVHLRLASTGMALAPENTHPFVDADAALAFAHNGGMVPAGQIEALLAPALREALVGTTDSERYFALVRTGMAGGASALEAAAQAVARLRPLYPHSSMNAVLLGRDELLVVHASSTARIPHRDFDASGLAEEDLPADHRTGYFQIWSRRSDDGTLVFSSSGLPTAGWTPLAHDTVTRVDLATLAVSTLPVPVPAAVGLRSVA